MPRKKSTKKGLQANKNPPRPRPPSPKPFQPNAAPDKTTEDGEKLWELNHVVASRFMYGKLYYQVSWKGWSKDEYWYPASDLKRCPHLLVEFHSDNPKAAGPPRRLDIWDKAWTERTEEGLERHEKDDLVMTAAQKKTWLEEFEELMQTGGSGMMDGGLG